MANYESNLDAKANLGGGGGGGDLAATLVLGNVTGGTDVVLSDGDTITGAAAGAAVPGKNLLLAPGTVVDTAPGALVWGADYASTTRGSHAVDLQGSRADATEIASGAFSTAIGHRNTASGDYSVAMGFRNEASGKGAAAFGWSVANGDYALSGGFGVAGGDYSAAFGYAMATGSYSFGAGTGKAYGDYSAAFGVSYANGAKAVAFGAGIADGDYSFSSGGPGTADGNYSFLHDLYSGDAYANGAGSVAFAAEGGAYGDYSFAHGYSSAANGTRSVAMGSDNRADGRGSMAVNEGNVAVGDRSFSMGRFTQSDGDYSLAMGISSETDAAAPSSLAGGRQAFSTVAGEMAWSAGRSSSGSLGASQWSLYHLSARSTGTTAIVMKARAEHLIIRADQAYGFRGVVTAYHTSGGTHVSASWDITGLIRRDGANTTLVAAAGDGAPLHSDGGAAAWTITIAADDANESLEISVGGAASTIITWTAVLMVSETGP